MPNHSNVETVALNITKKYGYNQCRDCATELREIFEAIGKKGVVLRLYSNFQFIVMSDQNFKLPFKVPEPGEVAICDSGQHFGVLVDGYVFDNIHRKGMSSSIWESTFAARDRLKTEVVEQF